MCRIIPTTTECLSVRILVLTFIFNIPFFLASQIIPNPSFEGTPRQSIPPPEWSACKELSTPDTQPGFWGVVKIPADGDSFVSIVTRGREAPNANTTEDIQVQLLSPLSLNQTYHFRLSLSYSDVFYYEEVTYTTPSILKIYGGDESCSLSEVLWESPVIDHTDWRNYVVQLEPENSPINYLILEANFNGSVSSGNILMDNFVECNIELEWVSDTTICEGEPLILDVTIPNGSYLWQDGYTEPIYSIDSAGIYGVTVSNECTSEYYEIDVTTRDCFCDTAAPIQIDWSSEVTLCEGEQLELDVSTPNGTYVWQDGSTGSLYTIDRAGTYGVLIDNTCMSTYYEVVVQTRNCKCDTAVPIQSQSYDSIICHNIELALNVETPGGTYTWWNGETTSSIIVDKAGYYEVAVSNGCITETLAFSIFEQECSCKIEAPNVFTPNGDSLNDLFEITGSPDINQFDLRIFNRFGIEVYRTDRINEFWDGEQGGKEVPAGVYYYSAELTCIQGTNSFEGWIQVFR